MSQTSSNGRPSPAERVWSAREALGAWLLVFASGVGMLIYNPMEVTIPTGVVEYGLLSAAVVLVTWTTCMSRGKLRLGDQGAVWGLVLVCMAFTLWFARWFHQLEPNSDNAEALRLGVDQLVGLQDPWAAYTQFGNPLSPMLGGFILAAPFVLIPAGMYVHQVVVFAAWMAFVGRAGGLRAAAAVGALFLVSPHTRYAVPGGSDNWVMAVVVLLAGSWGFWAVQQDRARLHWWASALLFGVSMSYRVTVWVAVLPLIVLFVREVGLRAAFRWFAAAGSVAFVLVLGPLLVRQETYLAGPWAMVFNKADAGVAHSGLIIAVSTLGVTALLSWRVRSLPQAWVAVAGGLLAFTAAVILTAVPELGLVDAIGNAPAVAYNGIWLVFGLSALAMRVQSRRPSADLAVADPVDSALRQP